MLTKSIPVSSITEAGVEASGVSLVGSLWSALCRKSSKRKRNGTYGNNF